MKVRVYYDGYKDTYIPQYRWFGIWRPYKRFEYIRAGAYCYYINREHQTKEDAIAFLKIQKTNRKIDQEREAAAKERSKKSSVVYEETI